jgi:hypothetical protein
MKSSSFVRLLAVGLAILISGCSRAPSWLQGDWIMDQDRTQHELTQTVPGNKPSMLSGLNTMLGGMLLSQLGNMEIIISGRDEIVTIGGQGKTSRFQIVNQTPTECMIKKPDSTVETYYRDGDEIYFYATGSLSMKIYFKRKP